MEFLLFQSLVLIPSVKKIQTILQTLALRGEQNSTSVLPHSRTRHHRSLTSPIFYDRNTCTDLVSPFY